MITSSKAKLINICVTSYALYISRSLSICGVRFIVFVNAQEMTAEELSEEKVAVQKALLQYEGKHGRPVTVSIFLSLSLVF